MARILIFVVLFAGTFTYLSLREGRLSSTPEERVLLMEQKLEEWLKRHGPWTPAPVGLRWKEDECAIQIWAVTPDREKDHAGTARIERTQSGWFEIWEFQLDARHRPAGVRYYRLKVEDGATINRPTLERGWKEMTAEPTQTREGSDPIPDAAPAPGS